MIAVVDPRQADAVIVAKAMPPCGSTSRGLLAMLADNPGAEAFYAACGSPAAPRTSKAS